MNQLHVGEFYMVEYLETERRAIARGWRGEGKREKLIKGAQLVLQRMSKCRVLKYSMIFINYTVLYTAK